MVRACNEDGGEEMAKESIKYIPHKEEEEEEMITDNTMERRS